jgi:hypothetical protein
MSGPFYALQYERRGHYDGMAKPMRVMEQLVIGLAPNKWGFAETFTSPEAALETFAQRVLLHDRQIDAYAKAAFKRSGTKSVEQWRETLERTSPRPENPRVLKFEYVP